MQPQPDAHLSTQHTYKAPHPRDAAPARRAAEEGGPTLRPACSGPWIRTATTPARVGWGRPGPWCRARDRAWLLPLRLQRAPGASGAPTRLPAFGPCAATRLPAPRPGPAAYLARPRPRRRTAARPAAAAAARRPGPARAQGGAASLRLPAPRPARGGSGREAREAPSGALETRGRLLGAAANTGVRGGAAAVTLGRGRPPLGGGSASLEAATATKMAAALSLGSGEGTRPGAGWRREGRGGERRRGARAAARGARGAWGGGGARASEPAGGARSALRGGAPGGVAPERLEEAPGAAPPVRCGSREHHLIPTRAPRLRSRARGTLGPVPPPSPLPTPAPKECRPRRTVQPRAPECQHPVPLQTSHVASQNLGVLFYHVEVMRGSLRGCERCLGRRGQRFVNSQGLRSTCCSGSGSGRGLACPHQCPEFVTQDPSIY